MKDLDGLRAYIAGPMESVGGNWNFPLFDYVATKLREAGCQVFSPAEHARQNLGSLEEIQLLSKEEMRHARRRLLQDELNEICVYIEVMFMLPGWEKSPGAKAEHAVAQALGLEIRELGTIVLPIDVDQPLKQADNLQLIK